MSQILARVFKCFIENISEGKAPNIHRHPGKGVLVGLETGIVHVAADVRHPLN